MDDFKDMDIFEKETRLHEALGNCLDKFSLEYNLTYSQIIGVLEVTKQELIIEFMNSDTDEDEESED